jgi:hypothetical protein
MCNAVAAINPERPEHHEHASEAAVPGEGLLHVRNLAPSAKPMEMSNETGH